MKSTVICRLYKDEASARGMRERLHRARFPRHVLSVVSPRYAENAHELENRIKSALVPEKAAKLYAEKVAAGASLVVVRATFRPLNAVRIASEAFESSGAIQSGLETDRYVVKTPHDPSPNILKDHPRFLSLPQNSSWDVPRVSDLIGLRLLSSPNRRDRTMEHPKRFFGDGIVRRSRRSSTLMTGQFMSRTFCPIPLLSKTERKLSVIRGGGHPFARGMGWQLPGRD